MAKKRKKFRSFKVGDKVTLLDRNEVLSVRDDGSILTMKSIEPIGIALPSRIVRGWMKRSRS